MRVDASHVSVLFNEPKLLKCVLGEGGSIRPQSSFSALQRAEIAEIYNNDIHSAVQYQVSVLFNEPKLLKYIACNTVKNSIRRCFSALQRAEIAEMRANAPLP